MKYVYIICSGHSGSTLLDLMLSNAANVFSMGEILRLEQAINDGTLCSCRAPVAKCRVWEPIIEPFSSQNINVFAYGADANLTKAKSLQKDFLEIYPSFARQVLEATGTDAICDSSKQLDRLKLLSEMRELELFVLYIQRHPGGVARSQMQKGRPFFEQVLVWIKRNFEISHFLKTASVPFKQLQYEALVTHPDNTMKTIFRFLEISFDPALTTDFHKLRHLIEGNRIRMNHQQLRVQPPSLWQNGLNGFQRLFANSVYAIARPRD